MLFTVIAEFNRGPHLEYAHGSHLHVNTGLRTKKICLPALARQPLDTILNLSTLSVSSIISITLPETAYFEAAHNSLKGFLLLPRHPGRLEKCCSQLGSRFMCVYHPPDQDSPMDPVIDGHSYIKWIKI